MASKGINTGFNGALLEQVMAYADRGGMSAQDAVRELVRIGLGMDDPTNVVLSNARQRAYDDMRRWVMKRFAEHLAEFSREVERAAGIEIWGTKAPRSETPGNG